MLIKIRNMLKQKGQGIVEYALLLAFIVGLAVMLNGTGISGEVKNTFDSVASLLGGEKTYAQRVNEWKNLTRAQLAAISPEERLKSDRELLESLARHFLSRPVEEVQQEIEDTINHDMYDESKNQSGLYGSIYNSREKQTNPDGTKESNKVQLFKYSEEGDVNGKAIKLNNSNGRYNNGTSAEIMTGGVVKSGDFNFDSNNSSGRLEQRVFYSDGMINQGNSRTIHARFGVDSNNNISSVHIYAKQDGTNKAVNGLDLTVNNSGVTYHPDNTYTY